MPAPPPPVPSPKAKRRTVLSKLKSKYRLLLINDATFEERFSIRLSRINVILLFLALFTLHGLFVTALIVFTPAKRYIPGYSDQRTKLNAYRATVLADSLQHALDVRDAYIANVRAVLSGKLPADPATLLAPIQVPAHGRSAEGHPRGERVAGPGAPGGGLQRDERCHRGARPRRAVRPHLLPTAAGRGHQHLRPAGRAFRRGHRDQGR
ncbi:MAG: hypothetical protein QM724_03000 [Flavobacteriales bacterium]